MSGVGCRVWGVGCRVSEVRVKLLSNIIMYSRLKMPNSPPWPNEKRCFSRFTFHVSLLDRNLSPSWTCISPKILHLIEKGLNTFNLLTMPPLEIQPPSPEMIYRSVLKDISRDECPVEIPILPANANHTISKSCADSLSRYEDCFRRADTLTRALCQIDDFVDSRTLRACKSSVLAGLPMMLRQTAALLENLASENSDKFQSSLALDWTEQYLSNIEKAISRDDVYLIDQKLDCLASTLRTEDLACSVSLCQTSELVFDLGLGPVNYYVDDGLIEVSAEPIIEIRANDLLNGMTSPKSVRPYHVEIESCKLHTINFPTSSERLGEAHISIRLTPTGDTCGEQNEWKRPTFCPCDERSTIIQEARICQTNSNPPRPAIAADMFTYCVFGESSLNVRLVVNTFRTERGEVPRLQVKLVLHANEA